MANLDDITGHSSAWLWRSVSLPPADGRGRRVVISLSRDGRRLHGYVNDLTPDALVTATDAAEAARKIAWPEPWLTIVQLVLGWGTQSFSSEDALPTQIADPCAKYVRGEIDTAEFARLLSDGE